MGAIPTKGIKREIAEAILLHYSLHLAIYERATLLKGDLTKKTLGTGMKKRKLWQLLVMNSFH